MAEAVTEFVESLFPLSDPFKEEKDVGEAGAAGANAPANAPANALEDDEEEAEEEEAVPVAKGNPKSKRQVPVPKDSASFFRARAKDPVAFTFTADGNLQVPAMREAAPKIIEIPSYRPSTSEEKAMSEAKRYDQIKEVEKEYDETLKFLKESMQVWRTTGASSDAIKYQRELSRLDALRTHLRSPARWTVEHKRLPIRKVLVEEFYEVKKLKYSVYSLSIRSIPFEELVQVGPGLVEEEEEVAPAEQAPEQEKFIFFDGPEDPDYGVLSPDTMIDFVFNSTMYTSFVQAYEVERITRLGRRKDFGPLLLKQRSPATIRQLGLKIAGDIDNPRELWIDILKTVVTQHPKYKDILAGTEKATLVYTSLKEKTMPKERRWGIGLKSDDPGAMDKSQWQGPNVLGQAWQAVRRSLERPEEEAGGQEGGHFNEKGKSSEEAKKQRSGVLAGMYRRRA